MTDDDKTLVKRLRTKYCCSDWADDCNCDEAADRIEAQAAEIERLRGALETAWKHATQMRNASKLVGPYPNDPSAHRVWQRSLYHEGKRLHELLKPIRAALGETE